MLEEDIDSMLMDEMDDDDVMSRLREERMMQLKHQNIQHSNMEQKGHGIYTEAQNDKQVLDETTGTLCCVVHFYKKEFKRCLIVDKHLKILAAKYFNTKFLKVEVDHAPFLVERLGIQVLPCIMTFLNGVGVDRVVGFGELGAKDDFHTRDMEVRLAQSGVLPLPKEVQPQRILRPSLQSSSIKYNDESDDDY